MTLNVPSLVKEAEQWRHKILDWDRQRKTADVSTIQSSLQSWMESLGDSQKLQQALSALRNHKDTLYHWGFFASRDELIGASKEEVQNLTREIDLGLEKVEALLKSV